MENVFVIQTNDNKFKKAISVFLSDHCKDRGVEVGIYEMTIVGGKAVMNTVKENNDKKGERVGLLDAREAQAILKQHAYYQNCSYEYAWKHYIHEVIKKRYSFEEVMRNI